MSHIRCPQNYVPYNGVPCKNGHKSPRYRPSPNQNLGGCVSCSDLRTKERFKDPEEIKRNRLNVRKYNLTNRWNYLLICAADRARKTGLTYKLTAAWARTNWNEKCQLTDIAFDLSPKKRANPFSPSIDRINPCDGYIPKNCRFILHGINMFKGIGTDSDMYEIAKALIKRKKK